MSAARRWAMASACSGVCGASGSTTTPPRASTWRTERSAFTGGPRCSSSSTCAGSGRCSGLRKDMPALCAGADFHAETSQGVERVRGTLDDSQRLAHIGSWEWDLRTGAVFWSDEMYRLHGHEPGAISPDCSTAMAHTHPDDRERRRRWIESLHEHPAARWKRRSCCCWRTAASARSSRTRCSKPRRAGRAAALHRHQPGSVGPGALARDRAAAVADRDVDQRGDLHRRPGHVRAQLEPRRRAALRLYRGGDNRSPTREPLPREPRQPHLAGVPRPQVAPGLR